MEPEISRRCKVCGASVRSRAGFCPQCGAPVNAEEPDAAPAVEVADASSGQAEEVIAPTVADEALMKSEVLEETAAQPLAVAEETPAVAVAASEAEAHPTRRHRVKVAARDAVEGKIGPRVEKLRHASTVVLDEAADDPGLRFVLVAAVLIILSLVILLLSQILD